jgi:hypothetical protein
LNEDLNQAVESSSLVSSHISTDIWTINDELGYGDYAYLIAKFITHPATRPPISVSIESPRGIGKTSLMRMIQDKLDSKPIQSTKDRHMSTPISLSHSKETVDRVHIYY